MRYYRLPFFLFQILRRPFYEYQQRSTFQQYQFISYRRTRAGGDIGTQVSGTHSGGQIRLETA
jgi:hypothetical protein